MKKWCFAKSADPGRLRLIQETILNLFPSSQSGERKKHFLLNLKVSGACSSVVFHKANEPFCRGKGSRAPSYCRLTRGSTPSLSTFYTDQLSKPGLGATVSGEPQKVNRGKKVGTDRSTEETNQWSSWVLTDRGRGSQGRDLR